MDFSRLYIPVRIVYKSLGIDLDKYKESLEEKFDKAREVMRGVYYKAKNNPKIRGKKYQNKIKQVEDRKYSLSD